MGVLATFVLIFAFIHLHFFKWYVLFYHTKKNEEELIMKNKKIKFQKALKVFFFFLLNTYHLKKWICPNTNVGAKVASIVLNLVIYSIFLLTIFPVYLNWILIISHIFGEIFYWVRNMSYIIILAEEVLFFKLLIF